MKKIMLSQCSLIIAHTVLKNITITACDITRAFAADDYSKIKIVSKNFDVESFLNKTITVKLNAITLLNGIITKVKLSHQDDLFCACLHIHSQLYRLQKNHTNRIFTEKNVRDIIKSVLEPYSFNVEFYLKEKQIAHPLVTQHQQSDFNFLIWLTATNGILFYLNNEKLIITDHALEETPTELPYITSSKLQTSRTCLFALKKINRLSTQTITLQDYNPLTAHLRMAVTDKDPHKACGDWIFFDNQAQDPAIQKQLLKYQRERQSAQHYFLKIKTNDIALNLNQLIKIVGHPLASLNQHYRIIEIRHHFNEYYYNECTLLPIKHSFRQTLPKKRYVGLQTATVYSQNTNTPNLNDHGHYQIKMPYQKQAINANLVRKLIQLTGPHQGQHFPLHDQTTVLLAYVNGELNNPVIIGSLTSDKNPDIVTNQNSEQHLLRTHTQQELCFDDDANNPHLHLTNHQQQFILNNNPAYIQLRSEDGTLAVTAENTVHHQSDGDFQQTIQGQNTTTAKEDYRLHAQTIHIQNQQDSIYINTKQMTNIISQYNDLLQKAETQHIQTNDMTLQATNAIDNQSLGIHESSSQTITITTETSLELRCGDSTLSLDNQGNMRIQSKTVEFHCNSLSNKTNKSYLDKEIDR